MIYLDNAATTEPSEICKKTLETVFSKYWGNPSNLYTLGRNSNDLVYVSRHIIAKCLNVYDDEIFFTSGASESNNWVMHGIKDRVCYCTCREHHSISNNPATKNTHLNPEDFFKRVEEYNMDGSKLLYSTIYVNNETGNMNNIKEIGEKCKDKGILYHADMTQAIGNIPVDMKDFKEVDFASFSGHKFGAPKGIGVLYIKRDALQYINPLIYGGNQEAGMRAGTENVAFIAAMAYSLQEAVNPRNIDDKIDVSRRMSDRVINNLLSAGIDFKVNSHGVPSILSLSFKDISGEALMMALSANDVYVGTGSACNTSDFRPSEVLSDMGLTNDYIYGTIRLSFSKSTTEEEIDFTTKVIIDYIKGFDD